MTWRGIVGRPFTVAEFQQYTQSLTLGTWHPEFCVLHNTAIPRLDQWHTVPGPQRMRSLERYYRDDQKWSAGPHLFIADDLIWAFTPLWLPGIHSPSWNSKAWGIEMVGDYDHEAFPESVKRNTIGALAALHRLGGFAPETLKFHKEDPKTTHKGCPGKNVEKPVILDALRRALSGLPDVRTPVVQGRPILRRGSVGPSVIDLQGLLGITRLAGAGAGVFGPITEHAVIEFQKKHGLTADGIVGNRTWVALGDK